RREDRGHRQQARGQALLPALRLPRRPAVADVGRPARAPPGGGHPPRRPGHAAPQSTRAQAVDQAEGVRRARPPARRPEARTPGDRDAMIDEERPEDEAAEDQPPEGERTAEEAEPAAEE